MTTYTALELCSFDRYNVLYTCYLCKNSFQYIPIPIILITAVLSFTNRLSRTSLYFSLKTRFVYSNLFSLAKTVTIRCYIQTGKRVRSPSSACNKARATAKKLQSINHFTIAACGNVIEFHSVLLFIDPSRLILMDSVICLSLASPW